MPTPDVLASTVMTTAAATLNDAAMQVYNYAAQLPFLKMAIQELREHLELNGASVVSERSALITVPIGTTVVGFYTVPPLPPDLVEINQLWESSTGLAQWAPMTLQDKVSVNYTTGMSYFGIWAWRDNEIQLPPATGIMDIKLDYVKSLLPAVIDQNTIIGVINSDLFLTFRTAALCAEFIGENKTRADELNGHAQLSLDRVMGIENKNKQVIFTRHRPFRAAYKGR